MGEIIAARSMNTLYIIVDVVILTLLAILLLIWPWERGRLWERIPPYSCSG